MKKKIFLALAVSIMLVCLFAIGVSAAGSSSNEFAETPETIEGIAAPTKIGASERVVMLGNDGLYYTFPAYYILNDNTSCSLKTNNSVNSVLGYADGTSHKNYVVRIEIPEDTTYINGNLLDNNKNLVYVKMPNTVTNTGTKVFQSCTNLETLILSNSLTVLQNDLCKGNSKLTSLVIPASVTAINGYAFDGCKISSLVNYAENIKSIGGNAFSGCPIENDFNFPDNLETIGQYAFSGAQFKNLDLPNTVTSLGQGVFQGCTQLSYVRIPEKVTQVPHDFLKNTTSASITLVVPKGCTSIYSQYSLGNSGIKSIIFTGDSDDAFVASVQEKASGWVSKITYGNHCEYYYDNVHDIAFEEGNTCCGNCSRCGFFSMAAEPVHVEELKLVFGEEKSETVDYYAVMSVLTVCENCGTQTNAQEYGSIFSTLGFTKAINATSGFAFGVSVNYDALEVYEEMTETTLEYGVVVSAQPSTSPITGVADDGKLTLAQNTLAVKMAGTGYTNFSVKLSNVGAEAVLNCAGYVIDAGKVTYLGDVAASTEAETFTYEEVMAKIKE